MLHEKPLTTSTPESTYSFFRKMCEEGGVDPIKRLSLLEDDKHQLEQGLKKIGLSPDQKDDLEGSLRTVNTAIQATRDYITAIRTSN